MKEQLLPYLKTLLIYFWRIIDILVSLKYKFRFIFFYVVQNALITFLLFHIPVRLLPHLKIQLGIMILHQKI